MDIVTFLVSKGVNVDVKDGLNYGGTRVSTIVIIITIIIDHHPIYRMDILHYIMQSKGDIWISLPS